MASSMDPFTTPGMEPPAGHIPNFDAPYTSLQIGTCVSFGITYFLATICLALRYFQAFKLIKKVELDLGEVAPSRALGHAAHMTSAEQSLSPSRTAWPSPTSFPWSPVSIVPGERRAAKGTDRPAVMGYGWGKHMYDVSVADLMAFNKARIPSPHHSCQESF